MSMFAHCIFLSFVLLQSEHSIFDFEYPEIKKIKNC